MSADRHSVDQCTGRMAEKPPLRFLRFHRPWRPLVWLLCAGAFSGCDFRPSAPESRASYFVEKFITAPQSLEDLRGVARLGPDESPETLMSDLPTRSAVAYLRARHQLGAELGFHIAGTNRRASGNRVVKVIVSESAAAKDATVRFDVELHNQDQAWLVVRLQSD